MKKLIISALAAIFITAVYAQTTDLTSLLNDKKYTEFILQAGWNQIASLTNIIDSATATAIFENVAEKNINKAIFLQQKIKLIDAKYAIDIYTKCN